MDWRQAIGARVRVARGDWTQAMLGDALEPYLGRAWTPQMVSDAEAGRRAFDADEIVALAMVLGREPGWFFEPPRVSDKVEMRNSDTTVSGRQLRALQGGRAERSTIVVYGRTFAEEAAGTLALIDQRRELDDEIRARIDNIRDNGEILLELGERGTEGGN